MRTTRKRYRFAAWKKLSTRGKQIRLLSVVLPVLCIALAVVSVNYLNIREDEQSAVSAENTKRLLQEALATQETPSSPEVIVPQSIPRPIVL